MLKHLKFWVFCFYFLLFFYCSRRSEGLSAIWLSTLVGESGPTFKCQWNRDSSYSTTGHIQGSLENEGGKTVKIEIRK